MTEAQPMACWQPLAQGGGPRSQHPAPDSQDQVGCGQIHSTKWQRSLTPADPYCDREEESTRCAQGQARRMQPINS
ncbi:unnamed protein product [Arctogadus glacialis]